MTTISSITGSRCASASIVPGDGARANQLPTYFEHQTWPKDGRWKEGKKEKYTDVSFPIKVSSVQGDAFVQIKTLRLR